MRCELARDLCADASFGPAMNGCSSRAAQCPTVGDFENRSPRIPESCILAVPECAAFLADCLATR